MALTEWPEHGTLVIWHYNTGREVKQIHCAVIGKTSNIAKALWAKKHADGISDNYVTLEEQERNKTCWVMVLAQEEWHGYYCGLANPPLANLTLAKAVLIEDNNE